MTTSTMPETAAERIAPWRTYHVALTVEERAVAVAWSSDEAFREGVLVARGLGLYFRGVPEIATGVRLAERFSGKVAAVDPSPAELRRVADGYLRRRKELHESVKRKEESLAVALGTGTPGGER